MFDDVLVKTLHGATVRSIVLIVGRTSIKTGNPPFARRLCQIKSKLLQINKYLSIVYYANSVVPLPPSVQWPLL